MYYVYVYEYELMYRGYGNVRDICHVYSVKDHKGTDQYSPKEVSHPHKDRPNFMRARNANPRTWGRRTDSSVSPVDTCPRGRRGTDLSTK